jgi:hypothetical protein
MTYRHVTNMLMPADTVDAAFLGALGDYKIGAPIATKYRGADSIKADGYVGVYSTAENMRKPDVMAKCGWGKNHERHLGQEWRE